jgi:hypothetical protein
MTTSTLTSPTSQTTEVPAPAVPLQDIAPVVETATSSWAPIPCHTILPAKRFRLR